MVELLLSHSSSFTAVAQYCTMLILSGSSDYRPCEACLLSNTADTSALEYPISSIVFVAGVFICWFSHVDRGLLMLDEAPVVNNGSTTVSIAVHSICQTTNFTGFILRAIDAIQIVQVVLQGVTE